jgi:LysR family transcriptional activator of nhaA
VFGAPGVAAAHRRRFPESLDGAPFLVPTDNTALRRSLDVWFDRRGLKPTIVAEIEDSAVMKVFGQAGMGLFAAPTIVEREVRRQYAVNVVGRIPEVRERFYAISVERRIRNPAVLSITSAARHELFGGD